MPETIEIWQLEAYIAVQLLCCLGWWQGGVKGWNKGKYEHFLSSLTPETKKRIEPTIDRLSNEIHSNINRAVYEDLPMFCKMIPAEHRAKAMERCKAILKVNPHPKDEIIRKAIEKHLK